MIGWPGWGSAKTKAGPHPFRGNPADHPDIEWEIITSSEWNPQRNRVDYTYHWKVAHELSGRVIEGEETWSLRDAEYHIEQAAGFLTAGPNLRRFRTRPCVLCDEPSRVGLACCSPEHEELLSRVRKEIADDTVDSN